MTVVGGDIDVRQGIEKIGIFWFVLCVLSALWASLKSCHTIVLHLKNYRRPDLQRLTIRILLMIPIYALATIVSLSSRVLSHSIDTMRDIYEAFVVYSFFILLVNYLEGERGVLSILQDRIRIHHLWPFNLFLDPMDMSDPRTFLFIRRGVLQFVILKLILAVIILLLKISGQYNEGYIAWNSAYLWLSLIYNLSVCFCMYCLVMFYLQMKLDLKPYRPFPKFVCVKVIIFATFWQGLLIAFLVRIGLIRDKESYTVDNMALSIQDVMICLELPLFAIMHSYAFPWTDYDDSRLSSRLLFPNAVRDVIGIKDVIQDFYHTFSGTTFTRMSYRRQRFLDDIWGDVLEDMDNDQLLTRPPASYGGIPGRGPIHLDSDAESLEFPDEEDPEVELEYAQSRRLEFGDYNFPVVHSDPRFAHPPVVRDRIDIEAQNFLRRIDNESQEALAKQSGASSRPSRDGLL